MFQNLQQFKVPAGFRGRNALTVQLWWLVQATLFRWSPQFMYGWRRFLLRCFGATVGKKVIIRPTVTITYPWKVAIGDYSWIGDDVVLYSLGEIRIGSHAVVSQKSYLCTGSHHYQQIDFGIFAQPIEVGDEAWLATDVFVAPGVSIGEGAVVGSRSSVYQDLPAGMICFGNPAKPVKAREKA
jgi:putative colanic acid biosynthesis acetyltransferase WcaF